MGDNFLRYLDEADNYFSTPETPEPMEDGNYGGVPFVQEPPTNNYKKGGKVRKKSLRSLAQTIQAKGRHGDSILAHINPQEAELLKAYGGSGTINPETGQPEFFFRGVRNFFKNPAKTISKAVKNPKRTLGDILGTAGALFGGPVIGALTGGARSMLRDENPLQGIISGAAYGYGAPKIAGLAGQGLSALGAETAGSALQQYGTNAGSSLMGTIGNTMGTGGGLGVAAGDAAIQNIPTYHGATSDVGVSGLSKMTTEQLADQVARQAHMKALTPPPELSFMDKSKAFLTKPETMLSLGSLGLNAYGQSVNAKEAKKAHQEEREYNSPEAKVDRNRRYKKAMKLSPEEIAENNQYLNLLQGNYHSDIDPLAINEYGRYRKEHTPEEYERTGNWFSYYDKPGKSGKANYAEGGPVRSILEVIQGPTEVESRFIGGDTGGQDDEIPAMLSDGEYVIDASTVSDLGDGNSTKGAKKLDKAVKSIRKHKRGGKLKLPPKSKPIIEYIGGK